MTQIRTDIESLELRGLTVSDGFDGDVNFTVEGECRDIDLYLHKEETIKLRDWLTRFLEKIESKENRR